MNSALDFIAIDLSIHCVNQDQNNKRLSLNPFKREFNELSDQYKVAKCIYTIPYYSTPVYGGCIFVNNEKKEHVVAFRGTQQLNLLSLMISC
jgi:hypothetical protein